MTKKAVNVTEQDIIALLEKIDEDPASYDAFVNAWNSLFSVSNQNEREIFADVEGAAISSLVSMDNEVTPSTVGYRVGSLLEGFGSPAYLVKEDGQIVAQNTIAWKTYELDSKSTIDDLPFELEQSEAIVDIVLASISSGKNSHDAILKRAYSIADDSAVTLTITPSKRMGDGSAQALVFVIDARWKTRAAGLIRREFDLSITEQELLVNFLDGQSTKTMAKLRQRSHTTIRTQFHSLMGKMGAKTQTELLRNALSISQFVDQVDEIAEIIRHPHRKRVDLVRPGGRSVEVTMAGDLTGYPIVFLQSGNRYTFESKIEQAFHDAGYCILSICRPGYGDTDSPSVEGDDDETFAADLEGLLDQLGYTDCLVMSSDISSAVMYRLSRLISKRVKGLIQVAAAAPVNYHEEFGTSVSWANAMINSIQKHPSVNSFMAKTSVRAWKALGQSRFRKMAFKMNEAELEQAIRPEALQDAQIALDTVTKRGYETISSDMRAIFSDFRQDVLSTVLPILIVHGSIDPVFHIEAVRKFATDLKSRITFVEIPEAGFSVMATHTDEILRHISEFEKKLEL